MLDCRVICAKLSMVAWESSKDLSSGHNSVLTESSTRHWEQEFRPEKKSDLFGMGHCNFLSHNMMLTLDMEILMTCKIFYVSGFKEGDCCLLIRCAMTVGLGLELLRFSLQFLLSILSYQWQSEKNEGLILWNHLRLGTSTIIQWVDAQALAWNRCGF